MQAALLAHLPSERAARLPLADAGRRHVLLARAAARASTARRCCSRPSSAASPSCRARRSTPARRARTRCACRSSRVDAARSIAASPRSAPRSPTCRAAAVGAASDDAAARDDALRVHPGRRLHRHGRCSATRSPSCTAPTRSTTERMQAFARWTNLSETTFLLAADRRRRRLPRAHLHARRRAAVRRPSDARQLPRVARAGRPAAGAPARWCSSAAVGLVRIRRDGDGAAFAAPPLAQSDVSSRGRSTRVLAALGVEPRSAGRRAVAEERAELAQPAARLGRDRARARARCGGAEALRLGRRRRRRIRPGSECDFEVRGFVGRPSLVRGSGHRQPQRRPRRVADRQPAGRPSATSPRRARGSAAPAGCGSRARAAASGSAARASAASAASVEL